ncbi:hypothetical protein ACGF8B_31865 [Streptomyces sp. NPDC047917]|uniref:hypothetical protein n=1 Tax=Streptomyces sp. NPDC047917 TaxID=3365491 RepID=UPI00371BCE9E
MLPAPVIDATAVAVGLSRPLCAAGVATGPDRTQLFLGALGLLYPARRAGRLTPCGSRDDLERYDRVFAACFDRAPRPHHPARSAAHPKPRPRAVGTVSRPPCGPDDNVAGRDTGSREPGMIQTRGPGSAEDLRHRDMAGPTAAEGAQLRRLLTAFALSCELRRTAGTRPSRRRGTDPRRTVRELPRHSGEPVLLATRTSRLRRPAHRVVRADHRKAQPGCAPLAAGTAAALPHVDASVDGHGPAVLEQLASVVRGVASDA